MKVKEIMKLKEGDKIFWKDPDEACSKEIIVKKILFASEEMVQIVDNDGYLECLPQELVMY